MLFFPQDHPPSPFPTVHPKVQGTAGYGLIPSIPGYNRSMGMRWRWSLLTMAAFAIAALAADEPQNLTLLSCPQTASSNPACNPTKADLRKSKVAFSKALKLQKAEHFDEAYEEFDTAARLVPKNVEYVTALAMVRQQLVLNHLQHGNDDLAKGKLVEAQAEFRSAANLDPQNDFARQRLQDSMAEWAPK